MIDLSNVTIEERNGSNQSKHEKYSDEKKKLEDVKRDKPVKLRRISCYDRQLLAF